MRPITGRGKILVMDDEEVIRRLAKHMLSRLGYDVDVASDGAEAIALYERAKAVGAPFDAAILDLTVPGGIGGQEAIGKLRQIDPQVKAIVSSGYSNDPIMSDFKGCGFKGVVAKPYDLAELSKTLDEVVKPRMADRSHA